MRFTHPYDQLVSMRVQKNAPHEACRVSTKDMLPNRLFAYMNVDICIYTCPCMQTAYVGNTHTLTHGRW
jgi:hypothetical protein